MYTYTSPVVPDHSVGVVVLSGNESTDYNAEKRGKLATTAALLTVDNISLCECQTSNH